MPTKEEQYNEYCKYLHTEQIRDGLICNTGKKSGRSLYRGNLIEPYKISDVKLMTIRPIYKNLEIDILSKDIFCCNLCDAKAIYFDTFYGRGYCHTEKPANITICKHIADNHYEYCYSCDNCYDYFHNKAAFKDHTCKAYKGYDV